MNILLVTFEFPPYTPTGGIGAYMLHLSKLLVASGERVFVFSANPGAEKVKEVHTHKYSHFYLPAKNNDEFKWKALRFFETFIKHNRVDVIESPEVGACALAIKQRYPHIPLVVKLHTPGVLITKISRYHQPLSTKLRYVVGALLRGRVDLGYWAKKDRNQLHDEEYRICQVADVITSPSLALKRWAVSFWGLPKEKIHVVLNPYHPEDTLFDLPLTGRSKQVCFIGKLSLLKGVINLAAAIPLILKANPSCKIVLVGRDEVENGVSMLHWMQHKLSAYKERVLFTGALPAGEVKKVLSDSALCIVPSLWENYPTVILEAMAAGVPIVASNKGGIPEMIQNKRTGMLVNPSNPYQLLKAVNYLLQDEPVRFQMAENARQTFAAKLNDNGFKNQILSVYTSFVEN